MSTSTKVVPGISALDFTVSKILTFQIVDLQKAGQGHTVHFLKDVFRWQIPNFTNVILYIFYFR